MSLAHVVAPARTEKDEEIWEDITCEFSSVEEPVELLFGGVARGCIVYCVVVILHRLYIAGPPTRPLAEEIEEASTLQSFEAWLNAPIPEPWEQCEALDSLNA